MSTPRVFYEIVAVTPPRPGIAATFLRKDTRLYFHYGNHLRHQGTCVGILWMCNPATKLQQSQSWGAGPRDRTLTAALRIMDEAHRSAKKGGTEEDDYIQVLNLFYVCNTCPASGWSVHSQSVVSRGYLESPCESARFCWIAWGGGIGGRPQHWLPGAVMLRAIPNHFFYSSTTRSKRNGDPSPSDYPVHPGVPRKHRFFDFTNYDGEIAVEIANHI
jgi:hypothetical protein